MPGSALGKRLGKGLVGKKTFSDKPRRVSRGKTSQNDPKRATETKVVLRNAGKRRRA